MEIEIFCAEKRSRFIFMLYVHSNSNKLFCFSWSHFWIVLIKKWSRLWISKININDREWSRFKNSSELDATCTIPEGQKIILEDQLISCNRALDQVSSYLYGAISDCDMALQNELTSNILISGGVAIYSNFSKWLKKDMDNLSNRNCTIHELYQIDNMHLGLAARSFPIYLLLIKC